MGEVSLDLVVTSSKEQYRVSSIPHVTLNDGTHTPQLGFGVFRVPPEEAASVVSSALQAGYRALDTAAYYGNEVGVGQAIRSSDIPREELHVTTKVWHTDLGYDATLRAFDRSVIRLQLEYVDMYLIHWPVPTRNLYVETWCALETLQKEGRVRSIGVSNFTQPCIERLLTDTDTVPALNQIEVHPWLSQRELREFHTRHRIATQAWSPLAHGYLLNDPRVLTVAEKHECTAAQVLLQWNLALGNLVLAKSVTPERMRANLDACDLALTDDDQELLSTLDIGKRTGPDPEYYGAG